MTHTLLTEPSVSVRVVTHDRKGREGKGREGKSFQDQVDNLTVGAPTLDLVWGSR